MKKMRLLAMLLALVMVAAACGSDSTTDEADGGDAGTEEVDVAQSGDLTFHMITHSDDGPFWSVVQRGMEAACDDLGVTCVWNPGVNDPNQMVSDIEAALAEGTDGIAASLPDPAALVPVLQGAVAGGTPVVTLNSGANDYQEIGALTHVGQTEFIAGQAAGNRFNDAGVTHVLCGRQEQTNVGLTERCGGLADTFNGTVTDDFMDLDADQAAQIAAINAAMAADESIDGFLGVGPVIAMSGLQAANDLGRDVTVGGFDLTPDLLGEIEAGNILFTVDQQQYLQGYLPILTMYLNQTNANVIGGGLPILTGPGFVTADNAADVLALSEAGTR